LKNRKRCSSGWITCFVPTIADLEQAKKVTGKVETVWYKVKGSVVFFLFREGGVTGFG